MAIRISTLYVGILALIFMALYERDGGEKMLRHASRSSFCRVFFAGPVWFPVWPSLIRERRSGPQMGYNRSSGNAKYSEVSS
jgi:hypothetical protein